MQLLALQALRAAAATAVVLCHAGIGLNYWTNTRIEWINVAAAGVDLFFVISGFIITFVAWDSFGRAESIAPFVARRFIRIGLLYWLVTTVYVLANSYPASRVIASYFLLPMSERYVIPIAWTLVYELMFYLLFAACLILPRAPGLIAVIAALIAITLSPVPFYSHPMILEFALGIAIAVAYKKGFRLHPAVAVVLIAAGLATFLAIGTYAEHSLVKWGIPAGMIVAGAMLAPNVPANRFWCAIALVGDASYALYLTHLPITHFMGNMARLTAIDFAASPVLTGVYFAVSAAVAIAVALLVFRFIEAPALEASKRFLRARVPVPGT